ncbi:MAG: nucleotidyltransferase domain-containing protein [Alphaproteobacteria bacterium]|nr:nucleotidyltransferase domain-containing protein [Alphaproteobacteria bacterium]
MSTSAERQRRRRARLLQEGKVDVSVTVPVEHRRTIQQMAYSLNQGGFPPLGHDRLRPALHGLKSMKPALQQAGVLHAGVFGSTARGDGRTDSDIDIVIDIDVPRVGNVLKYINICESIKTGMAEFCPNVEVDVANQATLRPGISEAVEKDVIYAF